MRKFTPKISQIDNRLEDQMSLGFSLLKQHRTDEALKEFEAVLERAPELTMIRLQVSQILLRRKQYRRAFESFQQTLKDDAFTPQALLAVGQILLKSGDFEAADEYFQAVLALDPLAEWAHVGVVEVLFQQGQCAKAIEQCQLAISKNPKVAMHHFQLAVMCYQQKDRSGAVSALHKAITLDPGFAPAHAYLAQIYADEGDLNRAQASFCRAFDGNPLLSRLQPQLQLLFISTLLTQQQLDDVEILLRELPNYEEMALRQHRLQGDYYLQSGAYEQAAASYRRALMLKTIQAGTFPAHLSQNLEAPISDPSYWQGLATAYLEELDSQGEVTTDSLIKSAAAWL